MSFCAVIHEVMEERRLSAGLVTYGSLLVLAVAFIWNGEWLAAFEFLLCLAAGFTIVYSLRALLIWCAKRHGGVA